MVSFDAPAEIQCSTSIRLSTEASPKAISRRTSYLRVRLEFLRYPHLIPTLFNGCGFGPPLPLTAASTWTWIGHPVSGLLPLTKRPIKTWFPFGSKPLVLNLASKRNSPDRSTKSTRLRINRCLQLRKHNSFACRSSSAHSQTFGLAHVAGSLKLPSILLVSLTFVLRI